MIIILLVWFQGLTKHGERQPRMAWCRSGFVAFRNLVEGTVCAEEEGGGWGRPCGLDEIQEPTGSAQEPKAASSDGGEP